MDQLVEKQHIVCTPGTCGGKPRIAGTRIRVQDIVIWHEHKGCSPEEIMAAFPQITLADVHAALAYYFDNIDEIRRQMKESEDFVAQLRAQLGPGPLEQKLKGLDASGAPLSS
jgi:uncharacterized protein (DUF433 family)